jgi:hypothetical protein
LPHGEYRRQLELAAPSLASLQRLAVDRGGVGDAVLEMLPSALEITPVVIVAGRKIKLGDDGTVVAGKAALLSLLLRSGVTVDRDAPGRALLRQEMEAFQCRVAAGRAMKMEAPDGAKDDLVIAACLAVVASSVTGT